MQMKAAHCRANRDIIRKYAYYTNWLINEEKKMYNWKTFLSLYFPDPDSNCHRFQYLDIRLTSWFAKNVAKYACKVSFWFIFQISSTVQSFFRGYNLQVIPMSIVSIFQCLYYFEYTRRYGIKKLPIGLAPIGLPILLPPIGFARSLCLLDISISKIWGSDGSCDRQSQLGIFPPLIVKFKWVVLL